ncbi:hypothetical protein DRO26_02520 [Candidatus Bathyarchaeota archaeon]|nr:MAG: hypothetical protein DRO26_02520 [Candidatus Bathyarchaeota archaeon]
MDSWEKRKKAFMDRLAKDRYSGYFDEEMYGLVSVLNANPSMYTTSCCSGRILLVKVAGPWLKSNVKVLGRWHGEVNVDELTKHINSADDKSSLWVMVQPPIIHVSCKDLETASKLVLEARNSGFKETGIFVVNNRHIMVEIKSSEKMNIPLVLNGKTVLDFQNLTELSKYLNKQLKTLKLKIKRLEKTLLTHHGVNIKTKPELLTIEQQNNRKTYP